MTSFLFCVGSLGAVPSSCSKPSSEGLFELFESASAGAGAGGAPQQAGGGGQAGIRDDSKDAGTLDSGSAETSQGGGAGASSIQDAEPPVEQQDSSTSETDSCVLASFPSEACDGLDNNCDLEVDEGTACEPGCFGFEINGHGYMYCAEGVSVAVAEQRCQLNAMRLVWLETTQESLGVSQAVGEFPQVAEFPDADLQRPVRTGANDVAVEGQWGWTGLPTLDQGEFEFWSGGPLGETVGQAQVAWADGQPNNNDDQEDCGTLLVFGGEDGAAGEWNDVNCDSPYAFVCEAPN